MKRLGDGEERGGEALSCFSFCLFVIKLFFSKCCCLSEPTSPPSAGNSSAERRLSRAPCVKNYVR